MPLAWNHRHIWLCLWNPNNCLTSFPLEKKFMGSHNSVLWYIMNLLNLNCLAKHRRERINKWLQHIWLVSAGSCFLFFFFMSPQSLFYLSLLLSSCRQHDRAGALGIKIVSGSQCGRSQGSPCRQGKQPWRSLRVGLFGRHTGGSLRSATCLVEIVHAVQICPIFNSRCFSGVA